jgi:hypothetical protein
MAGNAQTSVEVAVNNAAMHGNSCLDARESDPVFELFIGVRKH